MYTLRTRFAKDIVAEFLPPSRPSHDVIILCDGMPTVPSKKHLLEFFSKKGFWVFHPRYRGTWESGGSFLRVSPEKDILDVIGGLSHKITDLRNKKKYSIKPKRVFIFGCSFGGAGALLASRNRRVTKIVALSPVVDWRIENKLESIKKLRNRLKISFGEAYRYTLADWKKFEKGTFYNPMLAAEKILGTKILMLHAKNDGLVPWKSVRSFATKIKSSLILFKKGEHFSLSHILKPNIYKHIQKFLKK